MSKSIVETPENDAPEAYEAPVLIKHGSLTELTLAPVPVSSGGSPWGSGGGGPWGS